MEGSEAQEGKVYEGRDVRYTYKGGVEDGDEPTIQLTEAFCTTHGWIEPNMFSKNKRGSLYHNAVVHHCERKGIAMKKEHAAISEHSNCCAQCCQEINDNTPIIMCDACKRSRFDDEGIPFSTSQLSRKRKDGRRCEYCLNAGFELPELAPGQEYGVR